MSGSATLATILVERVWDGITLLFFVLAAALFVPMNTVLGDLAQHTGLPGPLLVGGTALPFIAALGILLLIAVFPQRTLSVAARALHWLPASKGQAALGLMERFIIGLACLRSPVQLVTVLAMSVPIWLIQDGTVLLTAQGFGLPEILGGWQPTIRLMLLVTSTSNLATTLPAAQGAIGTFEYFAAAVVIVLGVSSEVAGAFALVLHMSLLLPVTVVGLALLWASNLSLRQMLRSLKGEPAGIPVPEAAVERVPPAKPVR